MGYPTTDMNGAESVGFHYGVSPRLRMDFVRVLVTHI